jgi:hypothetical protein
MASANFLTNTLNIFAAPQEAFASIKAKPTVLFPLLAICSFAAAANWLYLLEVDIAWLIEQQLRAVDFLDLTEAQIEQRVNAAAAAGRTVPILSSVIGTFVFVILIMLIQALYLKIVSFFRKDDVRYKQWLSLVSWTALPAILASVAAIVFILTNDVTFAGQSEVNVLSFAQLLALDVSESNSIVRTATGLTPINLWSIALLFFGYRSISGAGTGAALAVVMIPFLFIIAIVIALI